MTSINIGYSEIVAAATFVFAGKQDNVPNCFTTTLPESATRQRSYLSTKVIKNN
ncbi:MAG TPA: hypothetical protein VH500_21475 [Nitrososphaeraceae archaeon]|jgi:hypothetical protein